MNFPCPAAHVVLAAILTISAGCKPAATPKVIQKQPSGEASRQQPSTAELANFARSRLPPTIKLVDLKNDPPVPMPNTAPGSNVWLYNVRLTFAPVEDELGKPSPQDAEAFQATLDELDGLVTWSQAYGKSPYVSLYPGFTVEPPVPASPQLLTILRHKDQPAAPIYGKMAAEWQVDHWRYSVEDMAMPDEEEGRYRSSFTGPVLIQGEPATERFVATVKAAVASAKPKKEAIERAYRDDLLKATLPGTIYRGQMSYGGKTMPAEVRFTAPPGGDSNLAQFELRLPASGYVYTCSAKLAQGVPNMPVPAVRTDDTILRMVEPEPVGDLTVNYEGFNKVKFNVADDLANRLYYACRTEKNVPLSLRNHQLKGKMTNLLVPSLSGIMLSAQQNP